MRIGTLMDIDGAARYYRVAEPLNAMGRRGHSLVSVEVKNGNLDVTPLESCDVVHVYRFLIPSTVEIVRHLKAQGVAIVWDNDDDYSVAIPANGPDLDPPTRADQARALGLSIELARLAHRVTVTTEPVARVYQAAGVAQIDVIPNTVISGTRTRHPHEDLVIGWIAGWEHWADAQRLGISDALQRVMDAHPHVRVETIGTELSLTGRYRHDSTAPFLDLLKRMASFDLGIAPLADLPFNHARSDIKVKEYAASGVPWLASNLTPYAHLGPEQGGQLVEPGDWLTALDHLVQDAEERRRLAGNGLAWAAGQTIEATADLWESTFRGAVVAAGTKQTPTNAAVRTVRQPAPPAMTSGPVRLKIRRPT